MYQVYRMRENTSGSLVLLYMGPNNKAKCYNEYFVNGYVLKCICRLDR
jgi:hypothetical protein